MESISIYDILLIVEKRQLLQEPKIVSEDEIPKGHGAIAAVEGTIIISGQEQTLIIGIDRYFPYRKPQFYLKAGVSQIALPHLSPEGFICYVQEEDLVIDYKNVEGIIAEAFYAVLAELEESINGKNTRDFVAEFEVYWGYLKPTYTIFSLISLGGKPRLLPAIDIENYVVVGENEREIKSYCTTEQVSKEIIDNFKFKKVLYLPLKNGTTLIPPTKHKFWTNSQIVDNLFQNVDPQFKSELYSLINRAPKVGHTAVVDLPINDKTSSLFGITFKQLRKTHKHPLISRSDKYEAYPASVARYDRAFILPRGGAKLNFVDKSVLLIGCGALGSVIAEQVLKAGITHLSLVDNDILKVKNIYRHKLGANYLHEKKVLALKTELERNLYYSNITAYPVSIESLLSKNSDFLTQYDLIISATANPTINFFLNEYLYKNINELSIIYTWIDPYGIGGHVLLSNNKKKGCYNCLYSDPSLQEGRYNRGSFAKKGQNFSKRISGCGSTFVPFGSFDTLQTTSLAVKLILDVLQGKEPGNPLLSWKGDAQEFIQEGYKLSSRYFQNQDELFSNRYDYYRSSCTFCNN